jgi:hypothetical protein
MPRALVGVVKVGTVRKWHAHKTRWDARFAQTKARVHRQRLRDITAAGGYVVYGEGGEVPPPSALVGRRGKQGKGEGEGEGGKQTRRKRVKGWGLAMWAGWGSKHDEATVLREKEAAKTPELRAVSGAGQGGGARHFSDLEKQEKEAREEGKLLVGGAVGEGSRAWRGMVGEGEAEAGAAGEGGTAEGGLDLRPAGPVGDSGDSVKAEGSKAADYLSPDYVHHETGVTGKRFVIGGLATPFSVRKEPETASMITLSSRMDRDPARLPTADSSSFVAAPSTVVPGDEPKVDSSAGQRDGKDESGDQDGSATPGLATPFLTPLLSPTSPFGRPDLERFVTAEEIAKTGA